MGYVPETSAEAQGGATGYGPPVNKVAQYHHRGGAVGYGPAATSIKLPVTTPQQQTNTPGQDNGKGSDAVLRRSAIVHQAIYFPKTIFIICVTRCLVGSVRNILLHRAAQEAKAHSNQSDCSNLSHDSFFRGTRP